MEGDTPDGDKVEVGDRRKGDSDRRTSAYAVRISFKKEDRENPNRRKGDRRSHEEGEQS